MSSSNGDVHIHNVDKSADVVPEKTKGARADYVPFDPQAHYNTMVTAQLIPTHEFPLELGPMVQENDESGNPVGEPYQMPTPWVVVAYSLGLGGESIAIESGYLAESPDEIEVVLLQPREINGNTEWIKRYINRRRIIESFELADADDEAKVINTDLPANPEAKRFACKSCLKELDEFEHHDCPADE